MKLRILDTPSAAATYRKNEWNGSDQRQRETGYYATRNQIPLISRILLSAIFLLSGIDKILHPIGTQEYMATHGMPLTGLFLVAAIVIELVGGLSLLLGYKARWGAGALAFFLVPATLIFHTNFADQIQTIMFMKNLAILGGLLMVIQYGPGQIALYPDRGVLKKQRGRK